ncbi:MAG TPA: class I adenylate-forming enzyme family protein, partial [Acidimicrobiales bacterium]|nr:class I adenylate-forming enzyme family protein [Acidimicrobiales bacterium]
MDLGRVLSWAAERHPARRAVGGERPLSYRQWDGWTNQLARALGALGVSPGARVVALVGGGEPLASLHLALQKLGAATVPLSTRYGVKDLAYCIGDAAPALVVSDAPLDPLLDAALVPVPEPPPRAHVGEDPPDGVPSLTLLAASQPDGSLGVRVEDEAASVMLYTSGTTGAPKGVPRSHRAELWAAMAHVLQAGYRDGEIALGAMPLFHTMGMRSLLASLVIGGTWVPQTRFD